MPVRVTSLTVPWSTSVIKREKLISCTFCPEFAFFTTCHSATAARRITTQKMTVLTVEFTEKLLRTAAQPRTPKTRLRQEHWRYYFPIRIRCSYRNLDR